MRKGPVGKSVHCGQPSLRISWQSGQVLLFGAHSSFGTSGVQGPRAAWLSFGGDKAGGNKCAMWTLGQTQRNRSGYNSKTRKHNGISNDLICNLIKRIFLFLHRLGEKSFLVSTCDDSSYSKMISPI